MSNDATYWLVFSLLLVGTVAFMLGRFYERADRLLRDWDAVRRARKAATTARARDDRLTIPRKLPRTAEKLVAVGRGAAQLATPLGETQVWR